MNKLCGEKLWAAGGRREAGGQSGRSQPETRTPHKGVGNKRNCSCSVFHRLPSESWKRGHYRRGIHIGPHIRLVMLINLYRTSMFDFCYLHKMSSLP